eukprot:1724912-Amphidinium_carterae.1
MAPSALDDMLPAALPDPPAAHTDDAPALSMTTTQAQRLHRAVLAGAGLRAWRCLSSLPLAPATAASWLEA